MANRREPQGQDQQPKKRLEKSKERFQLSHPIGYVFFTVLATVIGAVIVTLILTSNGSDDQPQPLTASPQSQNIPPVTEPDVAASESEPLTEVAGLDMDTAARIASGPGASDDFASELKVQDGNVVQLSTVVQNLGANDDAPVAEAVEVEAEFPSIETEVASISSSVTAANAITNEVGKLSDTVAVESKSGPIQLGPPNDFYIQQNQADEPGEFDFGRGIPVPDERVSLTEGADKHELTVSPTLDGSLGPASDESFRLVYLVDISRR